MANYKIEQIDDYKERLTDEQAEALIKHCNEFDISPNICAWYDDMDDFYVDWVYDNKIFEDEKGAYERYLEGTKSGEFKTFENGEIVRLVI